MTTRNTYIARMTRGWRFVALRLAVLAIVLQAAVPLTQGSALIPGEDFKAQGQDLPGAYLVMCTGYGMQAVRADGTIAEIPMGEMDPWDCPACQINANVLAPTPATPVLAATHSPLPRGCSVPHGSNYVALLWQSAPKPARAPPLA